MNQLVLWIGVVIGAVLVGEVVFRRNRRSARIGGDVSQAVGATAYFVIAAFLVLSGGYWTIVGFALMVFFYSIARTKWFDVRESKIRLALLGGGR